MPINFAPRRGAILMCDFGRDRLDPAAPAWVRPLGIPPEIHKVRRAVVVSGDAFNARQRGMAGLCTVVPLRATATVPASPAQVLIPIGRYRAVTKEVKWTPFLGPRAKLEMGFSVR